VWHIKQVQSATLTLNVVTSAAADSTMLLLAVGSSWTETGVTWSNAPSLQPLASGRAINAIGKNYLDWQTGPQPIIAGHITVPGESAGRMTVLPRVVSPMAQYPVQIWMHLLIVDNNIE